MENTRDLMTRMNKRLDELNRKTDYSLFEIKRANISFQNVIYSYGVKEKMQRTTAGTGLNAIRFLK